MAAGEKYGITPYGTEAMHVLRAEKGFIIVGQETDGTVTPQDLGMDWIVSKQKKDFLGKRSLHARRHRARRPQAAGRPADRESQRGAARGRPDRRRAQGQAADGHARPCHLELLQPELRPLDRAGAGQERPQPHGRDGACAAGRPHHPRQGRRSPSSSIPKGSASMVEAYLRRSPLAHRGLARQGGRRRPPMPTSSWASAPHRCQINLRGNADDRAFIDGAAQRHRPAPSRRRPTRFTAEGALACLWLGPDEWLIARRRRPRARICRAAARSARPASTPP